MEGFLEESEKNLDNESNLSYNSSEELMAQALPIDEINFEAQDLSPNTRDAINFLKNTRKEAASIPDSNLFYNKPNIKAQPLKIPKDYQKIEEKIPEVYIASNKEWRNNSIKRFQILKKSVDSAKARIEKGEQFNDFLENLQENIINVDMFVNNDKTFFHNFNETVAEYQISPSISILTKIDSLRALSLLEIIIEKFESNSALNKIYNYHQSLWIYAIFSCVQFPLLMESCGVLVRLLKSFYRCIDSYDKIYQDYYSYIGMMNVLIIIVMEHFGQKI